MFRRLLRRYQCAFAVFALLQGHAAAVVLDWDTVSNWVDGDLTHSYQPDATDPNSAITVTVTPNSGAPLVNYINSSGPMTPTVNSVFQGGRVLIEKTLTIAIDLANPSQSITVTMTFAPSGAGNVSFRLFDIDGGGPSQDQLSLIRGLSIDGTTLIAPTITPSADNTLIGTGLNQSVVGNAAVPSTGLTSGRGNVTIDFGSAILQSFTFTYGSTVAFPDPGYQHFGIDDISFTPVPEANPALLSFFSCLAAAGLVFRHRTKLRK